MSRPNMNQNMQNGIPPQWGGPQPPMTIPSQKNIGSHIVNNGLGSSQSSRDSSPAARVPTSQLPPSRAHIPVSQLPPSRIGVQSVTSQHLEKPNSNIGQVTGGITTSSQFQTSTPPQTPRIPPFSTSTPLIQPQNIISKSSDFSSVDNPAVVSGNVSKPTLTVTNLREEPVNQTSSVITSNMTMHSTNFGAVPQPNTYVSNLQGLPSAPNTTRRHNPQVMSTDPRFKNTSANLEQSNVLSHASSTPTLLQTSANQPSIRQNTIQSQNITRPVSSGPQLQQTVPQLMGQPQPQITTNPPQMSPLINDLNRQHTQLQPPQQFTNISSQIVPPTSTTSPPQVSPALPDTRSQPSNMNYPSQNVRQPLQNVGMPPNTFNTKPITSLPKTSTYKPTVSQYQMTSGSSVHYNRYPQQLNQDVAPGSQQTQPNMYQAIPTFPTPITSQQNAYPPTSIQPNQQSNAFNSQQSNTFNQQSNAFNQQQYKARTTAYPQQNYKRRNYQQNVRQQMSNLSVASMGLNKVWGYENFDLLQCPNILPPEPLEAPKVKLGQEYLDAANCSADIFRCTMTKIPESNSLLQKSRLPLGVLIHPFKDLNHLPVIQCNTIVRCRACRTYINPFIFFVDTKRWKCNLCYRINELPEEFQYDPVSKSYGDPSRRPEIKSSTIEYIAPSEYMLRPPQPAVYLYLLDISRLAIETGYLHTICDILASQLPNLPGDARTQIGFLAFNSTLHFFSLAEGLSQPHEMIVSDIDDVFLPCPDNLLVNLKEHMELIIDLLNQLPTRYQNSFDTGSALGSALQAAFKLMSSTGGRATVFQSCLPTLGPGALTVREDPNQRAGKEAPHLNPATDFYKRLALDCSAHQVAVDLFILNSQYVDIATLSGISRFSGGCMFHFPLFKVNHVLQAESLERCFKRYLTRKVGFEAVMRIRCTRGLSIHTFHGNFFVRSTDLLSLPNVNPDAGFGMQVSIEESLTDLQTVCFQAALLYTSSKGERRIRVHTLCLPVASTLSDILNSADQQCIVGLLAKMAVDRSQQSSLSDARDAFINAAIDVLSSYKISLNMGNSSSGLLAPGNLKLLPLYILALLKYTAFRTGQSTRLDDRVFAMCEMKSLPLTQLIQQLYPDLYPLHQLSESSNDVDNEGVSIPHLPRLHLSSRCIDSNGVYLLDAGQEMLIFVCPNAPASFLVHALGVPNYHSIPDHCCELPKIDSEHNQRLHTFINNLNDEKPYCASLQILRENSPNRTMFLERLIEDRIESALSYNEFLQHLKTQVK